MLYLKAEIAQPVRFFSCGHFVTDKTWRHMRRKADNYEVILPLRGSLHIAQDSGSHTVSPGQMLLLFPGQTHYGWSDTQPPVSFYWFHFMPCGSSEFPDEREANSTYSLSVSSPQLNPLQTALLLPETGILSEPETAGILFRQLMHTAVSQPYAHLACDYHATLLLFELTRQAAMQHHRKEQPPSDRQFSDMLEWLRLHAHENISVSSLADRSGYCSDYLTRLFKRRLGVGVRQYINNLRIIRARQLLTHTAMDIRSVSLNLGFTDEKYFMKLFRQFENMTPTQYRNAYTASHLNDI